MSLKHSDDKLSLWTTYRVRWLFLSNVCGSVPADPELVKAWLKSRQPRVAPAGALSIEEINEEVLASIERGEGEADETYSMLIFQRQHAGPTSALVVQRASTIKAHIKDCARVLSAQFIGRIQGERAFSTRVINGVYPDKHVYWVPITRPDGTPIEKADGAFDKAIHVRGPHGMMNAIKRFEYIEPPSLMEFRLQVLGRSVSKTDLDHVFEYGGTHGYGGERGDGEGRYEYELVAETEPAAGARTAAADR